MRLIIKHSNALLLGSMCFLATCLLPSLGYGETGINQPLSSKGQGPAVGTLLAAALETAGYKALSFVYQDLWATIHHLGAFFFLICLVAALISVTIFHSYEMGLWFLIGPALFFFVNGQFVRSSGAEWQFGEFHGEQKQIDKVLNETVDAQVPWLFHEYNRLISSVVQGLIRVISNKSIRDQVLFMTRPKITDDLIQAEVKNEGLRHLILLGLQADCSQFMNAARLIALANRDPQFEGSSEYLNAVRTYNRFYREKTKSLPLNSPASTYVTTLLGSIKKNGNPEQFIDQYCAEPKEGAGNDDLKADLKSPPEQVLEQPQSCRQIWCWTAMGLALEAKALMSKAEKNIPEEQREQLKKQTGKDISEEIWEEVERKFTPPKSGASAKPDISAIPVIIGGILLRKTLLSDPRSAMISKLADHVNYDSRSHNFDLSVEREQAEQTYQKAVFHVQAKSFRYEIFHIAMTLPYLQGAFLYIFAMTYPFFSLLLLIPSKASSFFTWMALWAWVKCWDVGWALVMVVDQMLWQLMPHSSAYAPTGDSNHTPITILESAFAPDATYAMSFYYTLLSGLMIAVPIVSAELILGGKAHMTSLLVNGVVNMSRTLGGYAADFQGQKYLRELTQLREFGRSGYAIGQLQQKVMASDAIKQQMRETTKLIEEGKSQKEFGPLMRQAMIGLIGGKPIEAAFAGYKAGTQFERVGNAMMALNNSLNGVMHEFYWSYSKENQNIDALRAMISGERGEHFNNPSASGPASVLAALAKQDAIVATQKNLILGERDGTVVLGAFARALSSFAPR